MKVYSTILVIASLFWSLTTTAQLSEGGIPPSFQHAAKSALKSSPEPMLAASTRSNADLLAEDELIPKEGHPLRIATIINVNVDIDKTGNWTTLTNGDEIWRQTIVSPNAMALILSYNELYIPEGGKLFLYNKSKDQVLGAYTHSTNPQLSEFSTDATYGDEVTLEYVASKTSGEKPIIKISDVGYVYRGNTIETRGKGTSAPCMIDINCPQGANWQTEKRGVVALRMQFSDGWYVCSGSLMNNTSLDKTPYILSANHCFYMDNEVANFATSTYIFNYERSGCGGTKETVTNNLVGAKLKATTPLVGGGDGLLVQLINNVPNAWNPYYNGWDITNNASQSGVVIHHPDGDFKKITTYTKKLVADGYVDFEEGTSDKNSHWRVTYSSSVTQGGSSGSPIFNSNKLVVGTLSGGSSTCTDTNLPDYFGRMSYHWNQYRDADQYMSKWLDPIKKGVTTLAGLDPNAPNSIGEEKVENSILIFPSPFDTELNINANTIIREIRVFDLSGRDVFTQLNYTSSTITISTGGWVNGAYSVLVKTDEGNITRKVLK